MEQRSNNVVEKDVQIKRREEEYAEGMGQLSKDAVVKGARTKPSKEECV
jgi:hypothetical protein